MASQKELIAVTVESMGASLATVTVVDRYLAEAGLRTHAKRGRGNTDMTYGDAANLIVATAWNVGLKDTVDLVREFRALEVSKKTAKDAPGETFGEVLEWALQTVAENREAFSLPYDAPGHMSLKITMYEPEKRAVIVIERDGASRTFEYRHAKPAATTDLMRTVQFTQMTLGPIGLAIAGSSQNPA